MTKSGLEPEPRPHAFTKAKEIAKALGSDWTPMPSHAEETMDVNWMAYLHGPDLRALTLNMGTWRNGRLTILGSAVRIQEKYNDPRASQPNLGWLPTISVDPYKDGETIAKDIKRRLMEDYEKAYSVTLANFQAMRRSIEERSAAALELVMLTGGKVSSNFPFSVISNGPTLDVDGADSVRFTHHQTFTVDQMRRLIHSLPDLFDLSLPARPEGPHGTFANENDDYQCKVCGNTWMEAELLDDKKCPDPDCGGVCADRT